MVAEVAEAKVVVEWVVVATEMVALTAAARVAEELK